MKAGIYYNIPENTYHADPCETPSLSAGIAKILLTKSPLHAFDAHPRLNPAHEEVHKEQFDIGKTAHSLILGDPRGFEIIKNPDWRTDEAKKRRADAYAEGKTPILKKNWLNVNAMVAASRAQLEGSECANFFSEGKSEVTIIWQEGDIWCRIRIDRMYGDGLEFFDYKTTAGAATPANVRPMLFSMGYDLTYAFYRRGIKAIMGIENPSYKFIIQETKKPYALSHAGITPGTSDLCDRKIAEAIRIWGECMKANSWPAYPKRTIYYDAPPWNEREWLEYEERQAQEVEQSEFSNTVNY